MRRPLLQRWTTFLIVLTVMVSAFWIVVSGFQAQDNYLSEKAAHAKASDQVNDLIAEQRYLIAEVESDNAAAAVERMHAADNLQLVLDYAKSMNERFSGLLNYLSAHGFKVPVQFLTIEPVPTLQQPSVSGPSGKAKSPGSRKKAKKTPKREAFKSSR